jgi:hypothetical protein
VIGPGALVHFGRQIRMMVAIDGANRDDLLKSLRSRSELLCTLQFPQLGTHNSLGFTRVAFDLSTGDVGTL